MQNTCNIAQIFAMKSVYIIYGIRLKALFRFSRVHGFYFRHPYLLRFLFLFQNAIWASFFSFMENRRYRKAIQSTVLPEDPLIIIGNWRTGSTYLHELLQYDPNGTTPTMFQVHLPNGFLFANKFYRPIMKFFMGEKTKRPFDNMTFKADGPQEDEFALLKMCGTSPLIKLIYPESENFFLLNFKEFDLKDQEFNEWKEAMSDFCKKIYLLNHKRIILKNPFHSLRMQNLRSLFPKAKFIHIYRNPMDVIPSTINMWNKVGRQNAMKPGFVQANIQNTTAVYDQIQTYIEQNKKDLPDCDFCEIKYEDLVKDPSEEIKKAYKKLEIPFNSEFEKLIIKNQVQNFKKNKFQLAEEDRKYICDELKSHMEQYGYATKS